MARDTRSRAATSRTVSRRPTASCTTNAPNGVATGGSGANVFDSRATFDPSVVHGIRRKVTRCHAVRIRIRPFGTKGSQVQILSPRPVTARHRSIFRGGGSSFDLVRCVLRCVSAMGGPAAPGPQRCGRGGRRGCLPRPERQVEQLADHGRHVQPAAGWCSHQHRSQVRGRRYSSASGSLPSRSSSRPAPRECPRAWRRGSRPGPRSASGAPGCGRSSEADPRSGT